MRKNIALLMILLLAGKLLIAQHAKQYSRAMKDELDRNIRQLNIPGLKPLFFISYAVADGTSVMIQSQAGSVIQSLVNPVVYPVVRTLTGDYQMTNEVAGQFNSRVAHAMPLDGDYDETRRVLWLATDAAYKLSAQEYTAKANMIQRLNIQKDELEIPDMAKTEPIRKYVDNSVSREINVPKLEKYMKEISIELDKYTGLEKSSAVLYGFLGDVYYVNSEGTDIRIPENGLTLTLSASVRTDNYAPFDNSISFSVISVVDLPDLSLLKTEIRKLAEHLIAIKELKPMSENYFGPILLENTAVGEFMDRCLVPNLINQKAWLGQKNLKLPEGKLGKKLVANGFSVVSLPHLKTYRGEKICGAFDMDYDGIVPDDSLILIEDGLVRNLLSNRVCTKKIRISNGYCRPNPENGMMPMTAPGVLKISSVANVTVAPDMKQKLLEAARKEGLDYAYIVRRIRVVQGQLKATEIYRVYTADGREELEQSGLLNLSLTSLRRIAVVSDREYVDNRTSNGMHVSYIYPSSMLVEEVDIDPFEAQGTQPPLVEKPKK